MKFYNEDMTNLISNETADLHSAAFYGKCFANSLKMKRKDINKTNDLLITSHRNLTCVSWLGDSSQKARSRKESKVSVKNNPYHESDKTINPTFSANLTPVVKALQTSELNPKYRGTHDLFPNFEIKVIL